MAADTARMLAEVSRLRFAIVTVLAAVTVSACTATPPDPGIAPSPPSPSSPPAALPSDALPHSQEPSPSATSTPTPAPSPSAPPGITLDPPIDITTWATQETLPLAARAPRPGEPLADPTGTTVCSAGVYATAPGPPARAYLLTARHCGTGTFHSHARIPVGATVERDPTRDLQALTVDPNRLPTHVRHYAGRLPLVGYEENLHTGQRACLTGAISGTKCNLVVTNTGTARIDDGRTVRTGLIMLVAENPDDPAAAVGDSGGVAYTVDDDGAHLLGIQTAAQKQVPCGFPTDASCFQYAFIADPRPFLDTFDATTVVAARDEPGPALDR